MGHGDGPAGSGAICRTGEDMGGGISGRNAQASGRPVGQRRSACSLSANVGRRSPDSMPAHMHPQAYRHHEHVDPHARRRGKLRLLLTAVRRIDNTCEQAKADIALGFVEAVVDVLTTKAFAALAQTGLARLVVAGGVGANRQLRERLAAEARARGVELSFRRWRSAPTTAQ